MLLRSVDVVRPMIYNFMVKRLPLKEMMPVRIGYGVGTTVERPSLGTAPGLLIYDTATRRFEVFTNPGLELEPGHGQRPAAVQSLATHGAHVVLIRPGALCPESYELARTLGLRFLMIPPNQAPDALMVTAGKEDGLTVLPRSVYDV